MCIRDRYIRIRLSLTVIRVCLDVLFASYEYPLRHCLSFHTPHHIPLEQIDDWHLDTGEFWNNSQIYERIHKYHRRKTIRPVMDAGKANNMIRIYATDANDFLRRYNAFMAEYDYQLVLLSPGGEDQTGWLWKTLDTPEVIKYEFEEAWAKL